MPRRQTFTIDPDSGAYEVNFGPAADVQLGELTYPCDVCGVPFPKGKTITFRGKVYGIPCGDVEDAKSIVLKERAESYRPPRRKPEREGGLVS